VQHKQTTNYTAVEIIATNQCHRSKFCASGWRLYKKC